MSDVLFIPVSGNAIVNGSIIVSAQNTGHVESRVPDNNVFVPSGTMVDRLTSRFDDVGYY